MANARIKTEMKGTGGGRWNLRADAKRFANKARRVIDRYEAESSLSEEDDSDLTPFWAACVGGDACDCPECTAYRAHEAELLRGLEALFSDPENFVTYCPFCEIALENGDIVADNPVYKCGELQYIELAHAACAPAHWRGAQAA